MLPIFLLDVWAWDQAWKDPWGQEQGDQAEGEDQGNSGFEWGRGRRRWDQCRGRGSRSWWVGESLDWFICLIFMLTPKISFFFIFTFVDTWGQLLCGKGKLSKRLITLRIWFLRLRLEQMLYKRKDSKKALHLKTFSSLMVLNDQSYLY